MMSAEERGHLKGNLQKMTTERLVEYLFTGVEPELARIRSTFVPDPQSVRGCKRISDIPEDFFSRQKSSKRVDALFAGVEEALMKARATEIKP